MRHDITEYYCTSVEPQGKQSLVTFSSFLFSINKTVLIIVSESNKQAVGWHCKRVEGNETADRQKESIGTGC